MILAWILAARADSPAQAWITLYDGRLVEAADGSPAEAARFYEEALAGMQTGDPMRGTVAWSLGRARLAAGDVDGAVAALRVAVEDPNVRPQAGALLALIEQERRQVRALPVTYTFDDDIGGFVRGWQGLDEGELTIGPVDGNPALAWPTTARTGVTDELSLGLAPGLRLGELHLRLRAQSFPAVVRLGCTDGAGGRYAARTVLVPTDTWVDVTVDAHEFRSLAVGDTASPRRIRTILLEDLTGAVSADRGPNVIRIDDVLLRE